MLKLTLAANPSNSRGCGCIRIPGRSAEPSATDEATFSRVFGGADWAVMFILARGGQTYARLRCNVGPGADVKLPVDVDYRSPLRALRL